MHTYPISSFFSPSLSLAHRDTELSRFVRTIDESKPQSSRMDQLLAADTANQRVIDQLNTQVDFLNEQLALREAQLVEVMEKSCSVDDLKLELEMKSKQVAAFKTENEMLSMQLRALDMKIQQVHF